ncbi:MAG: glycerol-3-phosphate 1-O-acyltransferase PlsY [Candidatus Limnocylindrales bacterium]
MDTTTIAVGVVSIGAAYLVGGIPWGVLLARFVGGPDPRTQGSGRTGGANVLRVLGPRVAAVAGILDLLKGVIAAAVPGLLGAGLVIQGVAVLVAIIGHSRSPYIGFRGGRGVSPAFGSLIVLWPLVALLVVPIFFGVIRVTRYSSVGSLVATTLAGAIVVAVVLLQGLPPAHLIYAVGAPALIWYFHRDNVERLLARTERTIDHRS